MSDYLLGLDLGTSSVKLILTDQRGQVIASAQESYPIIGKEEGRYEQNPEDWKQAIRSAMGLLAMGKNPLSRVSAIGLSGQMPSLVLVNKQTGEVEGNSILWCDSRADSIAADLLQTWGKKRYYSKTGIVLDGRYLVPMYLWLKSHGLEGEYCILSAKDYICYWLSGELITDPSTASGYAVFSLKTGTWDETLCKEAGIDIKSLPKIKESGETTGTILPQIADELGLDSNTKIAGGGADSVCGVLGLGAIEPGTICQMWGTSTAIIGITEKPKLQNTNKYFITPLTIPKTYGMEADLLSTGVSWKWMQGIIGTDMVKKVKDIPIGSERLFFYPFLSGGEQGVLWDPDLQAGILGLSAKHNLSHMAHALMEGMCFEVKRCLQAFDVEAKEILCTGTASQEAYLMQMLSNVLGAECSSVKDPHGSALGAAFLAGIAINRWKFQDIPKLAGKEKTVYKPDGKTHEAYSKIYPSYISNTEHMKQVK